MDILPQKKLKRQMKKEGKPEKKSPFFNPVFFWIMFFLLLFYISAKIPLAITNAPQALTYSQFYETLKDNAQTRKIKSLVLTLEESRIQGQFSDGLQFSLFIPEQDESLIPLIRENVSDFEVKPSRTLLANIFYSLGPMILFILFLWYFAYRGNQMGSRLWSFGKVKAKPAPDLKNNKTTFNDVAGVDEAEEELTEIIEFLKDPKKFQKLGGKIPKGVLLVGPPGCGKTLLAKAVAGEASAPFFSISGSDFVEMFVGVGASRVRDLFVQGKKNAPCIIFIDEIDAVGRHRGAGLGGGHDEREQTLNQLLVEMDGFESNEGVILISATNRPDVLDPALLRPGRFDRQVVIPLPDIKGREEIFKVHMKKTPIAADVSTIILAKGTPGFSGADLENLVNEAALFGAKRNKDKVDMADFEDAKDKVYMGLERKSKVVREEDRKVTAYHEGGHALVSRFLPGADPVNKITIIPRGRAAGITWFLPEERDFKFKDQLENDLTVSFGGRVAEDVVFNRISTGAANDIKQATAIAQQMVRLWGMSEELGPLSYGKGEEQIFLGREISHARDYSEETARKIDEEVTILIKNSYKRAKKILNENVDILHKLADLLLEKETVKGDELDDLIRSMRPDIELS